jgi:hypothetical protein
MAIRKDLDAAAQQRFADLLEAARVLVVALAVQNAFIHEGGKPALNSDHKIQSATCRDRLAACEYQYGRLLSQWRNDLQYPDA